MASLEKKNFQISLINQTNYIKVKLFGGKIWIGDVSMKSTNLLKVCTN